MQIQNNYSTKNSYSPNFRMIKKIEMQGLYKKHPEQTVGILNALQQNASAMSFFKKYDVSIILHAAEEGYNDLVKSTLVIFYKHPGLSKLKKAWNFVTGNEPKIEIFAHGYKHTEGGSTEALVNCIVDGKKESTGILTSHINYEEEQIQSVLSKKTTPKKAVSVQEKPGDKQVLDNAIKSLIETANAE